MGKWQLSMVGVTFLSLNSCLGAKAQFSFHTALVDGVLLLNSCRCHVKVIHPGCPTERGATVLSMVCPGTFVPHRVSPATSPGFCHVMPRVASLPPIFHIVKPLSSFI